MKSSAIYKIFSITNPSKFYIGSAINFNKRKLSHLNGLRRQKHPNKKLQNHFNKYGESDLAFEIIELVNDKDIILKREQVYIDCLNPAFNICTSATSPNIGRKHSEETKQKMKADRKGLNLGVKFSQQHRQNMSAAKKGTKPSLGRVLSEETKNKIRQSVIALNRKGIKQSDEEILNRLKNKMVTVVNLRSGIIYRSITDAANKENINRNTLYGWLYDERRNKTDLKLHEQ